MDIVAGVKFPLLAGLQQVKILTKVIHMNVRTSSGGFTLIELIVSSIIVSLLGGAAWFSTSVLMKSNEVASNQIAAVNLLRKSQEEVQRSAQANYDNFGHPGCDFTVANFCGFENSLVVGNDGRVDGFPGFIRTLAVVNEAGSPEFKRVQVTVNWNDLHGPRVLQSVVLLARPPKAFPGNLIGNVVDSVTGLRIGGVNLEVNKVAPPKLLPATSQWGDVPRSDGQSVNFSFVDASGQFQMDAGSWTLRASAPGYLPYLHSTNIDIAPNTERLPPVDVRMVRAPAPATIRVQFVNAGMPVPFSPGGRVRVYRAGALLAPERWVSTAPVLMATIPFVNLTPQCVTVATSDVFTSGFAGDFTCPGGANSLTAHGWSSAVMPGPLCSNPWQGNASAGVDRICVNSGQDLVLPIPVVPVPTATLQGTLRDNLGNVVPNADVYVRAPNWGDYPWVSKVLPARTNASGFYQLIIPAINELWFPGNNLIVWAYVAGVPITYCCNTTGTITVSSPVYRPGPILTGQTVSQDMVINIAPQIWQCGNANGNIKNAVSNTGINGATVSVYGSRNTNAIGDYVFDCPASPAAFSVPEGDHVLTTSPAGFYPFNSGGNEYYRRLGTGRVRVNRNQANPLGAVSLWPQGTGNIRFHVRRKGVLTPVAGAQVTLTRAGLLPRNGVTNAAGDVVFNNVLESWPATGVVGNPLYNQTAQQYTVTVTHPVYLDLSEGNITVPTGATEDKDLFPDAKAGF